MDKFVDKIYVSGTALSALYGGALGYVSMPADQTINICGYEIPAPIVSGVVQGASNAAVTGMIFGANEFIRRNMERGFERSRNTGYRNIQYYPNRFAEAANEFGRNFVHYANIATMACGLNPSIMWPVFAGHQLFRRMDAGEIPFQQNRVRESYLKKIKRE